jgi:phosphatidylinositol alpha-1,6-mannosyltransferase
MSNEQQELDIRSRRQHQMCVRGKAYATADIFVMANHPVEDGMGGCGIVLLEANMAETPAVAADLEGIQDVITDGMNGYRIPPLDERQFAQTINTVLSNGLAELSERTRTYVLSQFSWEHVAREYLEFISSVIEGYSIRHFEK